MKCPFCGHENTRVIDSRPAEENNSIRDEEYVMNVIRDLQPMRR